jgi:signal transduction histidine kinase
VLAAAEVPRLRWAAPAAAAYVVLLAFLLGLNLVRLGHLPSLSDAAWLCIAGLVLVWLLELMGLPWPRSVLSLFIAAGVAFLVGTLENGVAPMFLFLLLIWVAYTGRGRDTTVAVGLSLACLLPFWAKFDISVPWTVALVATWFAIQKLKAQQRTLQELRAAQADLAAQAAAAERQRIAVEIHDVVAHSLAVTMLHLTGARHILERDPQRAGEALAQAERLGRQSLADVRRTIGLLQPPQTSVISTSLVLAPLSTASDVQGLVYEYATAGMDVSLELAGNPDELPAGVSLAAYRITQEALANVAKHATHAVTRVELTIDNVQHVVHLRVRDGGGVAELAATGSEGSGNGMGVPGMRRRAELLGGSLFAGPDPAGVGWLVECTLPTTERMDPVP